MQTKPLIIEILPKRFIKKINFTDTCWLWTASKYPGGYGSFRFDGKTYQTHRFLWTFLRGEIPDGLCVLHKCDVRACIKPDHLFLGTRKDNVYDMMTKGRGVQLKGEHHGMSRLTDGQADAIRKMYVRGNKEFSQLKIAEIYGVDRSVIGKIVRGVAYNYAN
jgi:hypothetical protein